MGEEQRRLLTMVFSDLSGSTKIASKLEPEEFSALLDSLRYMFSETVARHGGEIVRLDGDGVFFIFGYPENYRDNARRAIEATLDMHAQVGQLRRDLYRRGIVLKLHSGVHSGVVLVRSGDVSRGRYEVLGDATNKASKLCDLAASGEIVVSAQALGGERHRFEVEPLQANHDEDLLGASMRYFRLVGRKTTGSLLAARLNHHHTPFVGRKAILETLLRFVEQATPGRCAALLYGEAGMGKSRLFHEFNRALEPDGRVVHAATCEAYLGASAFRPIRQIAGSIIASEFGLSDHDLQSARYPFLPEADLVYALFRKALPAADAQTTALADLLETLIGLKPNASKTVMIIDDWQWVDQASLTVIRKLLDKALERLVCILGSRAPVAFDIGDGTPMFELTPLSAEDVETSMRDILGDVDPYLARRVTTVSGGNPLYIEELCHSITKNDWTATKDLEETWLFGLVEERYDNLPAPLAEIVRMASVVGVEAPLGLLEAARGRVITRSERDALSEADFLFPNEDNQSLRFKHGLTRDAIYALITLSERRKIHRAVADAVSSSSIETWGYDDGRLAFHYANCGDGEAALTYGLRAGDRALAASILDKAQFYFKLAIEQLALLGEMGPRATHAVRQFGLASIVDPSWEQLAVLRNAVGAAVEFDQAETKAWAQYWLGSIYYGIGEPAQAIDCFGAARRTALDCSESLLLGQLDASLGQAHLSASRYNPGFAFIDRAIATKLARRSGARPSVGLAYALSKRGLAKADKGDFDAAEEDFRAAESVMEGARHEAMMSVRGHEATASLWKGDYDRAVALFTTITDMAGKMRSRYFYAISRAQQAAAVFYRDGDTQMIATMIEATDWLEAGRSVQYVSNNHSFIAGALAQVGDESGTRAYAVKALRRARKGDLFGMCGAYRALAVVSFNAGRPDRARRYLDQSYASARTRGSPRESAMTARCDEIIFGDQAAARPEQFPVTGFDVSAVYDVTSAARLANSTV